MLSLKIKFFITVAFILMFSITSSSLQTSFAEDYDIRIDDLAIVDITGDRYSQVAKGDLVVLIANVTKDNPVDLTFIVIIEVRNSEDVTLLLHFQKGYLWDNESIEISTPWNPRELGTFMIRAFVMSEFESPEILSHPYESSITVARNRVLELSGTVDEQQSGSDVQGENSPADEIVHDNLSLQELKEHALYIINEDRIKVGLLPVELSSNEAAQVHAEDVFNTRQISHWMTNGEKPYMTYSRYGGTGEVSQNVAIEGYPGKQYDHCRTGALVCEKVQVVEALDDAEYAMVYDDADSDWGHKDNILNPDHTHVSIGIAYDDYFFSYVQNFENNYLELSEPPITEKNKDLILTIEGELVDTKLYPFYLSVYYDEYPSTETYARDFVQTSYSYGDLKACVFGSRNWHCTDEDGNKVQSIRASVFGTSTQHEGRTLTITESLEAIVDKKGVYTLILNFQDEDGEFVRGFSYSLFHE